MGWRPEFSTQLGDGSKAITVSYSAKKRGEYLAVVFAGPEGKRVEKVTNCKRKDPAFHNEAAKHIVRAYRSTTPDLSRIGWEAAMTEVGNSTTVRPKTLLAFQKAIKQLRSTLDTPTTSPADITPELATRFGRLFMSSTYTRGKQSDAVARKRSPVTLDFYLRSLSALWGQFAELGYVKVNPWGTVRRPKLDKKKKTVPTEDNTAHFLAWVKERYPLWERLDLLLRVKLLSGCRTADVVQLRTNQLRAHQGGAGSLDFAADQVKNKEGRSVPLPEDLFNRLKAAAGKMHLWEDWSADCIRFRPSANNHKLAGAFDPQTVYVVLNNLFREYSDKHPDRPRLTPHGFRRRAITVMATATGSVDLTAQALGISAQTARAYYLDAARAFNTADAFRVASGLLLSTKPVTPAADPKKPEEGG
jgi:integrase